MHQPDLLAMAFFSILITLFDLFDCFFFYTVLYSCDNAYRISLWIERVTTAGSSHWHEKQKPKKKNQERNKKKKKTIDRKAPTVQERKLLVRYPRQNINCAGAVHLNWTQFIAHRPCRSLLLLPICQIATTKHSTVYHTDDEELKLGACWLLPWNQTNESIFNKCKQRTITFR